MLSGPEIVPLDLVFNLVDFFVDLLKVLIQLALFQFAFFDHVCVAVGQPVLPPFFGALVVEALSVSSLSRRHRNVIL